MLKSTKIIYFLFACVFATLFVTGCGGETQVSNGDQNEISESNNETNTESNEMHRMLLGTSSQGGTYFVWGGGWANIMNETVPGVDISVEVTGGPTSNIQLMEQGDMELGFVSSWQAWEAYEGIGWAEEKYEKTRAMFPMYPSVLYIYSLQGNNISDIYDFAGKHISVGAPGSTSHAAGQIVLEVLGIEASEISGLPTNTAVDNLRDGIVAAGFAVAGVPGPFMLDLETTHDVQHIELSQADLEKILEKYPSWTQLEIPGGTYKDREEDQTMIAFWEFAAASADLPDDLVYNLVKATFDNHDKLLGVDPSAKNTLVENVVHSTIPLHPGALRYYEEIGIEIPEHLIPPEIN